MSNTALRSALERALPVGWGVVECDGQIVRPGPAPSDAYTGRIGLQIIGPDERYRWVPLEGVIGEALAAATREDEGEKAPFAFVVDEKKA